MVHWDAILFQPPVDIANFMYLKVMKKGVIRVNQGVVSYIFDYQKSRTQLQSVNPRSLIKKSLQQRTIHQTEESENQMLNILHNKEKEIDHIEETVTSQRIQLNIKPTMRNATSQWENIYSTNKRKSTLEDEMPRKILRPSTSAISLLDQSSFSSTSGSTSSFTASR